MRTSRARRPYRPIRGLGLFGALILAAVIAREGAAVPAWTPPPRTQPTDLAGVVALSDRFPESAAVLRRVIAALLEAGHEAQLSAALHRLAGMGYALNAASTQAVLARLSAEARTAIVHRFSASRVPVGSSRLVLAVPPDRHLVEGVAWDAPRFRLFATSVVGRELLVHDAGGWHAIPGVQAGSLFGLALDPRRRVLWLASGVVEQTPSPDTAYRGLIGVDLVSLRVVRRVPAPTGGSPGDVAVAPDGTAYASDPVSGAVYRARSGAAALEVLVPAGTMKSPQGVALSPDGRRLYVADYGYGLAMIDPASGRLARVTVAGTEMLDGIDGLIADGRTLIAIQNGASPRRIVRLHLAPGGASVTRVEVLERANPAWGEPTLGTLVGGDLLYVADAQWERHGASGVVIGEGPVRPTAIRILGLRGSGRPPAGLR